MEWSHPLLPLLLFAPLAGLLAWASRGSLHPMSAGRRRALLAVRSTLVLLALLALAAPALDRTAREETVIFLLDHSRSQGEKGIAAAEERFSALARSLAPSTRLGVVSAGASAIVRRLPGADRSPLAGDPRLTGPESSDTDLEAGVALAVGLFPPSSARRIVLLSDGVETRGDLLLAAREAGLLGVEIDAIALRGEARPDVRLESLQPSRARLHEGAQLSLSARVQSSLSGKGRIRLFENGIEVESRELEVAAGEEKTIEFTRTPQRSQIHTYRALVEGFPGDVAPENDESLALVDVRGRPVILYVESDPREGSYLAEAMAREGIELSARPPESFPDTLEDLAGYDGVVISDVPAPRIGEKAMAVLRDYVEQLGGGFLMIGGPNSFGAGGYYRTAIEDVLPVKMKAPDQEEKVATALALVIDRSGSMSGTKIEICKSAAIATVELLSKKDFVGIVAFDSQATWVVPMARLTSAAGIAAQVASIHANGGTNIYSGMSAAREALVAVQTKVKHMIVLTDGQTEGSGYAELAARLRAEGVTVSTVGVGDGADVGLLQTIAAAGGGKHYFTLDPASIPKIFTQDAMSHLGKLIREQEFQPRQVERHPMIEGIDLARAPPLLGYVKTHRKATAQVPLVTDLGDPLLAHWRFGLGKVTAFTSDSKSRWSALWLSSWSSGYSQFWAQVLREMAREPQGRLIDLHLRRSGRDVLLEVALQEDAASWKNGASVEAKAYFVPAHALGSSLRQFSEMTLEQVGPGRYGGRFTPREPGVYLVRARSEAESVSAGIVENLSGESVIGLVNPSLLEKACALTGGKLLPPDARSLPPLERAGRRQSIEMGPALVVALLALFLADVLIRRWENVLGLASGLRSLRAPK